MAEQASETSLRRGRIGTAGIVFFVVAAAAPLVGMTGAVPVAILAGNGAAASGTYLLVGLTLLLFSVGFTAMTNRVTNAGAFFAYVGRGMGTNMGVGAGFASILGYVTIQLAIYGFFGGLLALQLPYFPWYVWAFIGWALVTALSALSVDVGAKVLGTLMIAELLSLVITGIAILVNHAGQVDFNASFNPANIFAGGLTGGAGIAIAFAFASFIGFEATAIYGEESVDPKRSVPRATYWAIGIITALFALVSFAMVTGLDADKVVEQVATLSAVDGVPGSDPAAVLFALASENVGPWMSTVMQWLVVSSLFAGLLAFQNANARYLFALGRGGVFPASFARTNKQGAPIVGVVVTSVLAAVVMAYFALAGLDPILNLFFWSSAITAVAIILVEFLVSISVVRYFAKNGGANVWKAYVAPIGAAILLAGGEYLLMSRFNLLGGLAPEGVDPSLPESAWQLSTLGWILVLSPFIALVVGYVVAMVRKENSELLKDIVS